ncbi:AarF/UbiB family protein [Brooklawnia sp.]|uniref:ABC1 kinase family protein n=1 Tax=Brooklawnia sp. TaxID=2699740 RepID=UPI00311DD611
MSFWDIVGQGAAAIYSLVTLGLVTLLVARTSKRVLGIQVSVVRALLVVIVIFGALGPLVVHFSERADLSGTSTSDIVALTVVMVGLALGVFALGMLVLMVLEVIIPTGSTPPLRVLLTGWGARFRRTRRYLQIMVILFRRGLTAPLRGVLNVGPSTAESVRLAMEDAGVTFVKLGQLLSTRSDLLPPEYIGQLSRLTSEAEPESYELVQTMLEEQLGDQLGRLDVDPTPLASASLAQVHAATLDGERQVVAKVQRTGAPEQVAIDLQILRRLALTLDRNAEWARKLGVSEIVGGFADSVHDELDFTVEVSNMESLRPRLVAAGVRVPEVHGELCSERVIVMERFDGVPVSRAGEIIAAMSLRTREESATVLLKAVLGQILDQGLFHADLHAGNVLVWPDGAVGLLDYGSVGKLDATARRNLGLLLWSVDSDDPALATDAVLELLDHDGRLDEHDLQRQLGTIITQVRAGAAGTTLAFFTQLLRLVLNEGMSVPGNIALALRSLGALEGTLKLLNPSLDLIETARDQARGVIGDIGPQGAKKQIANQAVRLVPLVSHLPRRINRITEDLASGRFTTHTRVVSHPDDQAFLTSLANQVVVAVLAGFAVIGAILLVTAPGGPQLDGYRLFDILGFLLGFSGFILALRSVAMVFGRRA